MAHFAFPGVGLMGAPMVRRLAMVGSRLRVWNRSSAKADACRGLAIDVCRSPAEALQGVETVFLGLTDASGGSWIDAPVSGGVAGATSGALAIFVGEQWPKHRTRVTALRPLARCITYLAAMGGRV